MDEDEDEDDDENEDEDKDEDKDDVENENEKEQGSTPPAAPPITSPEPFADGKELATTWEKIMKYPIDDVPTSEKTSDMVFMMSKHMDFVRRILVTNKKFLGGKKKVILQVATSIVDVIRPKVPASKRGVTNKPCCIFANESLGRRGSEFFKCIHSPELLITCKGKPILASVPNELPEISRYGKRNALIRA